MDLRTIIRDELRRREWSQRELCRRTRILPHQMCNYLNGNRDIYAETLERILVALELKIMSAQRRQRRR